MVSSFYRCDSLETVSDSPVAGLRISNQREGGLLDKETISKF
jgi:hypothetical protein